MGIDQDAEFGGMVYEFSQLALLVFKNHLVDVPHGVLSSWNDSLHFCQWQGVTCSRRHQRVRA
ncbi:hypothetical protein CK203_052560 [Vitis vinifera]|uniref:Leucine-rich repeat-containing N-terminal plant-type domain-containing protein n=1 Tax=Vitis vinifera TaxID=29760 RepID=A0A438GI87_VITVI|nr:hypothetical protein CK203_052560 [Vitis vinifera]